jgi:hypothetical protein
MDSMRQYALGLCLGLLSLGCSASPVFIESYEPTRFFTEHPLEEPLQAIREVKPGMSVRAATALLGAHDFCCVSHPEAKDEPYIDCYAFFANEEKHLALRLAVRLRLYYQDEKVTRRVGNSVIFLPDGSEQVMHDFDPDRICPQGAAPAPHLPPGRPD